MSQHWSEYWEQGHLTSFGTDFSSNYAGILKDIWLPIFKELRPNFEVLDIATGNGALPLLLKNYFDESNINGRVRGVDIAKIQPIKFDADNSIKIELIGEVNCESLPFSDPVDLVTSQFGIEYSNLSASLKTVANILKTGGRLSLVCHHHNSMIISRNKQVLLLIQSVTTKKLIEKLYSLADSMGQVTTKVDINRIKNDQVCEVLRNDINQLIGELYESNEAALMDSEILNYVTTFFKQGLYWSVDKKNDYLKFVQKQLSDLALRLEELVCAAIDETKLASMLKILSNERVEFVSATTLKSTDAQLLAWHFIFQKALK
ncbi:class I SAM-dependent methyltransferase [Shewanella morhuae]|uniref:Class I SAM-dependent methyltransferase n=1 Tax=Shewanella morhuae TaxID=365591 RepID=A0ABX5HUS5_9GAMM|nr:class I SAM-dependent methyltransferase [Shewanella morhuae]PTA49879.1 class I SAM-dependent methyltransferase [Shewanella morhuae]